MSFLRRPVVQVMLSIFLGCSMQAWGQVKPLEREKEQSSSYRSFLENPELKQKEEATGERQDDAAGRIDWWRQHLGGELTTEFKERLIREAEIERAKYPGLFLGDIGGPQFSAAVSGSTWIPIGPTDASKTQNGIVLTKVDSGRARTILPVPTDPNTVYFLTSGGGLWKTSNFQSSPPTWAALTDGIGSTSGGAAAFGGTHPGNVLEPNVVYVGFGDPFDPGVGGIIAKTSDGGSTFPAATKKVLPGVTIIYDVKVDFSGAADIILVGTNAGLFRSTDGGATYSSVATLNTGKIWSIVKTSAGWLAVSDVSNVATFFLSTTSGATWSSTLGVTTPPAPIGRTTFAVGSPGDTVVYAFAATTSDGSAVQKDLYRSTNGGATWTATNTNSTTSPTNPNSEQGTNDYMHTQAWYNQMVLVDPTDVTRKTVYIGGNLGSAKSITGGASWTVITNWLAQFTLPYVHADFHAAAFDAATHRIFFGGDGGLFTSTDGGTTWDDTKNKGLQTHMIYAMACGFNGGADPNSVLVGLQDNGTRLRVGSTLVYDQTKGGDGFGVGWSQANNAWTLGSYVYNKIARCTTNPPDDQSKWSSFTTGLGTTDGFSYYFVTPIIGAPATSDASSAHPGQNFYTYGNSGTGTNSKKIFTTASTGTSWTAIGIPGTGGISASRFVRAESHGISVSPVDLNHIAAAGNGGYALITTDGGTSWTERLISVLGVPTWPGYNSNFAWADNSKLYLCSVDTIAPSAPHVVKSLDGGANWTAITTGLPNVPVVKLAVDPGDATGETVYAATWLGLYRTTNGGTSWAAFGTGQPQGFVSDIYVAPDSSFLRIAYYGRGVWELGTVVVHVAVATNPQLATVPAGSTQPFSATVTNSTTNNHVNWTVIPVNGGTFSPTNTASGANTIFTAGATGTYTIRATSVEDPTRYGQSTVTVTQACTPTIVMTQNFDLVSPPALPPGWTPTTALGTLALWATTAAGSDTGPNAAFTPSSGSPSDNLLESPAFSIAAGTVFAQVSFKHAYDFEPSYDGGVLEISINGGASFADIITAGGSFVSGGYTGVLDNNASLNPLAGRSAWTGTQATMGTVIVNLPTASFGQSNNKLRWRAGSDNGTAGTGWTVDTININTCLPTVGATHFLVAAYPSPTVAGVAHTFTVTAQDAGNATVTTYTGTVHFTSTDGAAVVPANATLTSGVGTFSLTMKTAGTQSITATDTVTAITGSQTGIVVNPGAAATILATSGTPQSAVISTAFATAFTATVRDGSGNLVPGVSVTFAAPGSGASGIFGGSATVTTNASGVATAPTFTANATMGSYLVTASTAGVVTPANFSLTNTAMVATNFLVTAYTNPTIAGAAHTFTVTAKGAGNATVTTYTGIVHITSSDPAAVPPANATLTSGVGTFNLTMKTAGTRSITATDTVTAITGSQTGIVVNPGAAATILATSGTTQSAVVSTAFAIALKATVRDGSGNLVPGVSVTFTAPASSASGTFSGSPTVTTNALGVATAPTFTANATMGSYLVTASTAGVATPANFSLTNSAAPVITISVSPTTATILTSGTVVLTGTVNIGTINWVTSGGTLSAVTGTSVTFTPNTTGTFTVTATASADLSKTATATINVKTKDQDGNGSIDVLDLAYFARYFGTNNSAADLNGDGIVNDADITIFLNGF